MKETKNPIPIYLFCIIIVEASGFIVGMLTRSGTQLYADTIAKPPLAPPGIVFPIAWTILYGLMGYGIGRILIAPDRGGDNDAARMRAILLFGIQLALNLAWCFIFFGGQLYVAALIELVLMLITVILMTVQFAGIDRAAGVTQIPYILWLCFATYLNAGVVVLN